MGANWRERAQWSVCLEVTSAASAAAAAAAAATVTSKPVGKLSSRFPFFETVNVLRFLAKSVDVSLVVFCHSAF